MEESSQNENEMNNNDEIYLNDCCNGRGEDGRRITCRQVCKQKIYINVDEGEEKMKYFLKNCIFKEVSGDTIVEMHYVVHFIMQMTISQC